MSLECPRCRGKLSTEVRGRAREAGDPKSSFLRPAKRSLGFWTGIVGVAAAGAAEALGAGHGLREAAEWVAISGGAVAAPGAVGMVRDRLQPVAHVETIEATFRDLAEKTRTGAVRWTDDTVHTDTPPWGQGWHAKLSDGTEVELLQSILPPYHRGLAVRANGQTDWTVFSRPRAVISQGYSDVIAAQKERDRPPKPAAADPHTALTRVRTQLESERGGLK